MGNITADRARMTTAGLNLIQQALSIYDNDLRLAVSNRPFQEMFNLPQGLVTPGASFQDTIRFLVEKGEYGPVDNAECFVRARVDQALAFEPHYIERTRSNGRTISIEGNPLPDGGWVAVYTDITSLKRQEALLRARSEELSDQVLAHSEQLAQTNRQLLSTNMALQETKRQLTDTEARTRLVTEMMPAHIAHVGPDDRYTYSNRRLSSVMPTRPSDIVDVPISEALGSEIYQKIKPSLQRAKTGEASVTEFNHDVSGRRIRTAFTPDQDEQGNIRGVYIMSMDVTEETQTRAALIQTHKRELAAQLTSGMAHDFANLLTIILGLQSRLKRHTNTQETEALIQATQDAARRGGVLLDRIASISGPRDVQPIATDLPAFLAGVKTLIGPTLPDSIALNVHCEGIPENLMLDAGGLQDALLNLILNARDAIGQNLGTIDIHASTVGDTWLEISVQDSGIGFDQAGLKHALDPFYSTKGGEGSGLGLAMVFDTIKLSGGRVTLENTAKGARITIRLPLRIATSANTPLLVLLVEDTPEIRETVREMLIQIGHNVLEAATADEAVTLADVDGLDLILSDIRLGAGANGAEILKKLKETGLSATCALMSSLPKNDAERATANRVFPILSKPFEPADLSRFIQKVMQP